MNIDLDLLETIAKEATQGAWEINSATCGSEYGDYTVYGIPGVATADWAADNESAFAYCAGMELNDAQHIATFDPPTVLALIARIRELETENERLEGRRRERRKDDRKSLIEEMQATPEGRARLANARYNIEYEHVEELEATIQRVRDARSSHPEIPECDRYTDDDTIKCGWKSAVESIDKALEGEPK